MRRKESFSPYQTQRLCDDAMCEDIVNKIPDNADWEEIIKEILASSDGDYCFQAQALAKMKPVGW